MSVNKKLMVIGCSFSTGEECCDYEIVENYYDYKQDPDFKPMENKKSSQAFIDKKSEMHQTMHTNFREELVPAWAERPDIKQMIKDKIEKDDALIFPHNPHRWDALPYWQWYNDQHCYAQLLHDQTDYNVINAARRGTGINYQHLVYNLHRQIKANNMDGMYWDSHGPGWPDVYIPEKQFAKSWHLEAYYPAVYKEEQSIHGDSHENWKWNFNEVSFCGEERDPNFRYDECMDSADVLIWQFTGEPRYAVTLRDRDEVGVGSSIQQLDRWFENYYKFLPGGEHFIPGKTSSPGRPGTTQGELKDIPGKQEIRDWYKYYHDPAANMAKAVGWMENIIKLREAKGLKTIMVCLTSQFTKRFGINPRNNEHTVSIGFDYDKNLSNKEMVDMLEEKDGVTFNHNTEKGLSYQGIKSIRKGENVKAKWGHLNKEGHKCVADDIKEILEKWK